MNSIRKCLLIISILSLLIRVEAQNIKPADVISVKSPDGKILVDINRGTDSKLYYKIKANDKEIITPSRLGIVTDNVDLGSDFKFGPSESKLIDETYPIFGVHNKAINRCNATTLEILTAGEKWFLDVRAYDDGVGIRCRLPAKKNRQIQGEATEWKVPS